MAQTKEGALKTKRTLERKYGADYYSRIGSLGSTKTGGFASNKIGRDGLTGPERAAIVGKVGGRMSPKKKNDTPK